MNKMVVAFRLTGTCWGMVPTLSLFLQMALRLAETVTVTTLGQESLTGAKGTFTLKFNGMNVAIEWAESLQHFLIRGMQ